MAIAVFIIIIKPSVAIIRVVAVTEVIIMFNAMVIMFNATIMMDFAIIIMECVVVIVSNEMFIIIIIEDAVIKEHLEECL